MRILTQKLLCDNGWEENRVVEVIEGRIAAILPSGPADYRVETLTPGLLDLHCHGGEGFDAERSDLKTLERFLMKLLSCGVTGVLLTTSTSPKPVMRHALSLIRRGMEAQQAGQMGGARVLGVHLEGPFLSSARPGAMLQSAMLPPTVEAYEELFAQDGDIIRMMSLAPEEPGADELIRHLLSKGVCVQAGHTNATYEQAMHGFQAGVQSLCHSFNACRPIHHRDPGVVVAAMENQTVYMEAICDFHHLHPAIIKLIYREKGPDKMILISDSVFSHGLPDGEHAVGDYRLIVKDGVARTPDGALDGGVAYLDQAVRNLISIGIAPEHALRMASQTPAAWAGLQDLGRIAIGQRARLTAWNSAWQPLLTVMDGEVHPC